MFVTLVTGFDTACVAVEATEPTVVTKLLADSPLVRVLTVEATGVDATDATFDVTVPAVVATVFTG